MLPTCTVCVFYCDTIFLWEGWGHSLCKMINSFELEGSAVKSYSRRPCIAQGTMRGSGRSMFLASQDLGRN